MVFIWGTYENDLSLDNEVRRLARDAAVELLEFECGQDMYAWVKQQAHTRVSLQGCILNPLLRYHADDSRTTLERVMGNAEYLSLLPVDCPLVVVGFFPQTDSTKGYKKADILRAYGGRAQVLCDLNVNTFDTGKYLQTMRSFFS